MQLMLVLKRVVLYLHYAMGELEVVTKITYICTITGSLSLTRLILIIKIHFLSKSEVGEFHNFLKPKEFFIYNNHTRDKIHCSFPPQFWKLSTSLFCLLHLLGPAIGCSEAKDRKEKIFKIVVGRINVSYQCDNNVRFSLKINFPRMQKLR